MNRILLISVVFVMGLLAGVAVLGYFAYVIESGPSESVNVSAVSSSVDIRWGESGVTRLSATDLHDAIVGLGYAQAASATWPMLLYRYAALGELSTVTAERGIAADELSIQLGIGRTARAAFDRLPEDDRVLLSAFADGVNAALLDNRIRRDPSLLLLGVDPKPWEPWHTIAVERLFAWLGAAPSERARNRPDRPIRDILRLHDFGSSLVLVTNDPTEAGLYSRFVWGSSALPAIFEATLEFGGDLVQGATLVGTPFFVAGRNRRLAWAFLQVSEFDSTPFLPDSVEIQVEHTRIVLADGTERLVEISRDGSRVALNTRPARDTSSTVPGLLSWSGLDAVTDAEAWLDILREQKPYFRLIDGVGALMSVGSDSVFVGPEGQRLSTGLAFSRSEWLPYALGRLDTLTARTSVFEPRQWFNDTQSYWASRWTPALVARADTALLGMPLVFEAVSYLRNWDHRFDDASIAATIFVRWAEFVEEIDGSWPRQPHQRFENVPDSLASRWVRYLIPATDDLQRRFGPDVSTWRWERVGAGMLYYPILGSDAERSVRYRYAPALLPASGHPSTPKWGPQSITSEPKPTSVWEGWTAARRGEDWIARRPSPRRQSAFRTSGPEISNVVVSFGAVEAGTLATTLHPSD